MFSNRYIFIYSSVMVILVALALTIVAVVLKPKQDYNQRVEKMQNILTSVHIESTTKNAEDLFKKYIVESFVVDIKGENKQGFNAFDIEMQYENKKKSDEKNLPIFICVNDKNEKFYIVPVRGKGLWGPLWGYIAFRDDFNTIEGTQFDHKGETPGLGSEINTPKFQNQFIDKTIFNDQGGFVSVMVIKGGADDSDPHGVDAISGGTITSKGLEAMLFDSLNEYTNYFNKNRNQN
ncbi:MAG: NADH:ubiquinone reductase (Na(+)-transporting) subunit C [Tenuifilaceae bacterium]